MNSHFSAQPTLDVVRTDASTVDFHALELGGAPAIWLPQPCREPVLVLGSSQPAEHYSGATTTTRRRSGGGAVLVSDEQLSWFDVWIPTSDPRHVNDVSRSFDWLGQSLCESFADFGFDASMHQGAMVNSPWSSIICFAGLGPGEITIDGRKVVGISQRRNRSGARFQVAILKQWRPSDYLDLLDMSHNGLPTNDFSVAVDQLASAAVGVTDRHHELVAHIMDKLTGSGPVRR